MTLVARAVRDGAKAPNGSTSRKVWSILLPLRALSLTMSEAVANLSKGAEEPSVTEGMYGRFWRKLVIRPGWGPNGR